MRKSDRIKRSIAFYFSVILFFVTLPILLSYSLGYHIDFKALRIYKTGIIYVNSNPQGASIYINDRLCPNLTPAQVEELKPGRYRVEVNREGFYPWERELVVRPNMVTKADRIVLFPINQEIKRISDFETSDFVISDKNYIYCMTDNGLLKLNIDGTAPKIISVYSNWPDNIIAKKFSPDGKKILYFTQKKVAVVYLSLDKASAANGETAKIEEVLSAQDRIKDVFWYSGSGYIVVVTDSDINVIELLGGDKRNITSLYKFTGRPAALFYDTDADSLYFTDTKEGTQVSYIYRLDLRQTFLDSLKQLLPKKEAETENETEN